MLKFLVVDSVHAGKVLINIDAISSISRNQTKDQGNSIITTIESDDSWWCVKETVEELENLLYKDGHVHLIEVKR